MQRLSGSAQKRKRKVLRSTSATPASNHSNPICLEPELHTFHLPQTSQKNDGMNTFTFEWDNNYTFIVFVMMMMMPMMIVMYLFYLPPCAYSQVSLRFVWA